jgi:predicted RNA binding protein with dsRBD fold (UPF0201 family)
MKCEMKAKTPLNPTEDVDKIIKSLSNMFDYDQLEIGDTYISVTGGEESLLKLKEALKIRRIRNTARKILIKDAHDRIVVFKLNKQSAFVGIVNFSGENISSLGEINVKIEVNNIEQFIDWLAPLQA